MPLFNIDKVGRLVSEMRKAEGDLEHARKGRGKEANRICGKNRQVLFGSFIQDSIKKN